MFSFNRKLRIFIALFMFIALPALSSEYTIILVTGNTIQCDTEPVFRKGQYVYRINGTEKSLPAKFVKEIRKTSAQKSQADTGTNYREIRYSNQPTDSRSIVSTESIPVRRMRTVKIKIPIGTKVYGELDERVISKKKKYPVGQRVKAKVWRNVVVDGRIVIKRGARMGARVSLLKTNKMAGVKGKIEISADYVKTVDNQELPIQGGYGKEGQSYVGRTIALSVLLLPLIFIRGKKAELPPGTVFEAYTDEPINVQIEEEYNPQKEETRQETSPFEVTIMYDKLGQERKPKYLEVIVSVFGEKDLSPFVVSNVNSLKLEKPIALEVLKTDSKDGYLHFLAHIKLKSLIKKFRKGINTFTIASERKDCEGCKKKVTFDVEI
jgi:hypothetical protein